MVNSFFTIGVGPGDPSLLTLKAIKTIRICDVIAIPLSGSGKKMAFEIIQHLVDKHEVIEVDMPMTKDGSILSRCHNNAVNLITGFLNDGKNVGFVTIGDPSIYSTASYIHKKITKLGFNTVMIPGVTSFCAVAAALNEPLCESDEVLHIIPGTYIDNPCIHNFNGNKVIMKSGKNMNKIKKILSDNKNTISMVSNASMPEQIVYKDYKEAKSDVGYFSTLIIKESNNG